MIYIIEGPDGTGKTTLAKELLEQTKGHLLHCSYDPDWDMEQYHRFIMETAEELCDYQDVIIDRWAPSEYVYGTVFRDGPEYDTSILIEEFANHDITWIYCRNDNAVENHLRNAKTRKEMFEDMEKVVEEFDDYIEFTTNNWIHIPWIVYDFDKVDINKFVERIIK